jgi:hypothetical protein
MSDVVVVRNEQGKLEGLGEKGRRAFGRFQRKVEKLEPGETLAFSWREPRSSRFHRLHFAILSAVFEAQEQFQDLEAFRMWCQVGAGACDLVPGPNGKPVAIPKSIAYHAMDDSEFHEHHEAVVTFLRSAHATRFLWPWMSDVQGDQHVDAILSEFDR